MTTNMQAHLDKLRAQIVECETFRDLETDDKKRELFAKFADHLRGLAAQMENAIVLPARQDTFLGRKTFEPFPAGEVEIRSHATPSRCDQGSSGGGEEC